MSPRGLPLIGITAANDPAVPGHYILRWDYVSGVEASGGIPVILAPTRFTPLPRILDRIDGVVLSGGLDISPELYGGPAHPTITGSSLERDEFEAALIREALARDMPILGICRGMQMVNVVLGGDLVQDLPTQVGTSVSHNDPGRPRNAIAHPVGVDPGTRLAALIGREVINVNSFHHQAVRTPGTGFLVSSRSSDGVVEGMELPARRFVLGVQWHPETLWPLGPPFSTLFRALVEATGPVTPTPLP